MEQNYLFPNEIESAMDPRTQRTKMSLRRALCDILEKKKLEQITVHELTAEANINRSTFYLHYSNVSEVFREIEDSLYSQYQSTIQQYQELIKNKYYGSDVLQYASMKLLSEGLTLLQKYPTFSPILIEEGLGNRLLRKILSSVEINVSRLNLESSQNPRKRYAQYYIQ